MDSTATSVAVDLSISQRQSSYNWAQDKATHHVLKHGEISGSYEAEGRFSSASTHENKYSCSGRDRRPIIVDLKSDRAPHYAQVHVKVENSDGITCESNNTSIRTNHTFFSADVLDYKLSCNRTSEIGACSGSEKNEDQEADIVCKKVIIPSSVEECSLHSDDENATSALQVDLDCSTKIEPSESSNCFGMKLPPSEGNIKLPIRMMMKLNSASKKIFQQPDVANTSSEAVNNITEIGKNFDSCNVQQYEENSLNSLESIRVLKEEPFDFASSPLAPLLNFPIPNKSSINFDQQNGRLRDDSDSSDDGKVESGESSDGDTHESFVNETEDSKISLDNDGEDETDYKFAVRYPLRCVVCSRDFLYRAEYFEHCRLHESYDENILLQLASLPEPVKPDEAGLPFYCEICGKGFMNKQAIKHHFIIHTDERPHTCNICKKSYRHRSALYKHKRSHTDVLAYACDVCGKRFKHKSYLNIHAVIHTQQRPYSCNICGSTFRDRSARNKHLHAHSGVRPYSCEVCGKCFGRKGDYKSHSVIHTEQRPYKCDVCGRGFRSSSNYHRHSRTHTTDCPYKCDTCGKSFNQNWKLKEHKFVHTDKLPYVCEICGAGFKYPRKYKQHMENHARERLHNQETAASTDQLEEPPYEVIDVQPDIMLLLEQ